MLTPDHLWPIDDTWNYHCARSLFNDLDIFTDALSRRYGEPGAVADYAWKAQAMAYESNRAMYEAFGRNKYSHATGVIKWMLNNGWPSLFWNLYDYYLRPGGAYFGAKKALEPLHIQYAHLDQSVVIVNSYNYEFGNLEASADLYDLNGKHVDGVVAQIGAGADSVNVAFQLPQIRNLQGMHFLRLNLKDAGALVSTNTYWLANPDDALDWPNKIWYYTPQSIFADFTALQSLPRPALSLSQQFETVEGENHHIVTVTNEGPAVAFQIRLSVRKGEGGEEVLPVIWKDNYFVL